MNDIPEWAVKRANDLTSEAMKDGSWLPIGGHASAAFARYIAEHEEPPVDPLLIEAREIAVANSYGSGQPGAWSWREKTLAGSLDDEDRVRVALAALKRGMELAREEKP